MKKNYIEMSNEEWASMFRKAITVDEVFDVVDNGYDKEEWDNKEEL